MRKRRCYIHAGPHKSGTSSIQWFLQENRTTLLEQGYFVPAGDTRHGAHHSIVRRLCGQELPAQQQSAAADFVRALTNEPCEAVILSSEALEGLLRNPGYARAFFKQLGELNLETTLILFPRNQPQWINSSYASAIKTFRQADSFEAFAWGLIQRHGVEFSRWVQLADVYKIDLVARPFSRDVIARGVIPQFLLALGIRSSEFRDVAIRRNEGAGPFTVAVARAILRSLSDTGSRLTYLQAMRCKARLAAYLNENGLADAGYCGLTTTLARQIEKSCRPNNDAFAQRTWNATWEEIFSGDVGQEFAPNDYDICEPDAKTRQRLARAIAELKPVVDEIMRDAALAVDAGWNDLRQRAGAAP